MYPKRKRLSLSEYLDGILQKDRVVLSRAITLIESRLNEDQELGEELLQQLLPYTGKSLRIGITGVPGVGKSTFIDTFGEYVLTRRHTLAVLTIDPSSQTSKGSILGDKTRMSSLSTDKRAFIRPSPAGATLGGVGARTREAMLLCEAAGFEVVFVETVGVGQSETLVKGMVDFFLLLMLAGAGDELQGIKKGIIETADALVITKADGDNLDLCKTARNEYNKALHLFPRNENGWRPRVKLCSALEGSGVEEIWALILDFEDTMKANGYFYANRSAQRLSWMHSCIQQSLQNLFYQNKEIAEKLGRVAPLIENGEISAMAMARKLIDEFLKIKQH